METLNGVGLSIGLAVWGIGLLSKAVKSRWPVSDPLLATLFGIVIGFLLLLRPVFRPLATIGHAAFDGWFGPIGVGALFYVAFAHGKTGSEAIWNLGTLLIFASIIIHGVTATPFTRRFKS